MTTLASDAELAADAPVSAPLALETMVSAVSTPPMSAVGAVAPAHPPSDGMLLVSATDTADAPSEGTLTYAASARPATPAACAGGAIKIDKSVNGTSFMG